MNGLSSYFQCEVFLKPFLMGIGRSLNMTISEQTSREWETLLTEGDNMIFLGSEVIYLEER